jgi:hypothetical protein
MGQRAHYAINPKDNYNIIDVLTPISIYQPFTHLWTLNGQLLTSNSVL